MTRRQHAARVSAEAREPRRVELAPLQEHWCGDCADCDDEDDAPTRAELAEEDRRNARRDMGGW